MTFKTQEEKDLAIADKKTEIENATEETVGALETELSDLMSAEIVAEEGTANEEKKEEGADADAGLANEDIG